MRSMAQGAACALDFESGREGDRIVTRRKGVASITADARGVAAHAGNEHEKGRNAIWSVSRFVDRVQALTDYARGVTVNVGFISGGTTKNTVPAEATCELDLRFLDPNAGDQLLEQVWQAAATAAVQGTRIDLKRGSWRPPLDRTERSAALAREYGECQEQSGLGSGEAPLAGGGSDAATCSAAGVPAIDGLGPRGHGYHTPEERIDLRSLVPKAEALVRFLARRVV
jgi:glutamate carboxypeptidase